MTIRDFILAALAVGTLFIQSCSRDGETDFRKLNARAAKEYLEPVRPGVPGGQPFWNIYANKFTFSPSFDFPEAEGAVKYRFDLWWLEDQVWREYNLPVPEERPSAAEQLDRYKSLGNPSITFLAGSPKADLGKVWGEMTVGYYGLVVTAINADGKDIAPVGTWEFLRDFQFEGPYPEASRSYFDAALMALLFNHRHHFVQMVRDWKEGEPFQTDRIYMSKHIGSVAESEALMSKYIPSYKEECLENARKAADLLISLAPKEGKLAHIPPTYYGPAFGDMLEQTMTFDPIYAMRGYLAVYDATGDRKYLDEAVEMMRTYDRLIDDKGFVPKKIYIATGEGVNQSGALSGDLLLMIQKLRNKYGINGFESLTGRCEAWMRDNAIKEFNMSAQYEDVSVDQHPYQNLTNMTAGYYARYLLQKDDVSNEEIETSKDLLHFVEDQFIHWKLPRNSDGMFFCLTPGVYEQYACKITIDASNDCYSEAALSYYEKTGDELFYQKAKALMNTVVNSQSCDGEIGTMMGLFYHGESGSFWINCSVHSIEALLRLAALDDSRSGRK